MISIRCYYLVSMKWGEVKEKCKKVQKIIFKPMNCLKFTTPGFIGLEIGDGC